MVSLVVHFADPNTIRLEPKWLELVFPPGETMSVKFSASMALYTFLVIDADD